MKIFEIPEKLNAIMDIEDDEQRNLEMQKLDLQVKTTFTDLVNFIKSKESDCEAIDSEIKRLQELKRIRNNKVEFLKSYIKTFMELNGIKRHEFPTFVLTVANNPPSVEIINEKVIPDKYKREEIITKIDKAMIKSDIQAGNKVIGASLVNKTSLRIK